MGTVKGVGVDKGAVAMHDPVTVVITPEGRELDADTWSDANNYVAAGCAFKDGYPTYPGDESHEQEPARPAPAQRPAPTQVPPSSAASSASA